MSVPAFRDTFEDARLSVGLSRAEVARRAGLSGPGLLKALGPKSNPTQRTMRRLAAALGMEIYVSVRFPSSSDT